METNHSTSRYGRSAQAIGAVVRGLGDWETVAIAIILMTTGLVLVGGDLFGILSLDRIQNLWPVALIAVGVIDLLSYDDNQSSNARVVETKGHARQF